MLSFPFSSINMLSFAKLASQSWVTKHKVEQFGEKASEFTQPLEEIVSKVSPKVVIAPKGPAESVSNFTR